MSSKKSKQDLNISGLSPLVLNILSPKSGTNSPAKDYAVLESIDNGKDSLIAGHDKWKLAESNGLILVNNIHNFKERTRTSSEPQNHSEIETYCKKLKAIESIFENIISQVVKLKEQMKSSINILTTIKDNEELKSQLVIIERFCSKLQNLYKNDLKIKKTVIENIGHTRTSEESHVLIASWSSNPEAKEIFKLIMQLKLSPADYRWCI